MNDLEIIKALKGVCEFHYKMEENFCTEISFFDEEHPFENTIRKNKHKTDIVKKVAQLSCLKSVNLRKCRIGHIPRFVSTTIECLDISCNDLEEVPDWVIKQKNLNFLNLGANNLKTTPSFEHLPLETLKLHKNNLIEPPKTNDKIKSLNLYLNPLQEFPQSVLKLPLLEAFSLGATTATTLPSISSLSNLKWLTLTVNQFETLPEDLPKLKKLEGLQLAKNHIKELPKEIGVMNLKVLTLYSNQLATLPDSFFDLKLKKLNLANNFLDGFKERIKESFGHIDFIRI